MFDQKPADQHIFSDAPRNKKRAISKTAESRVRLTTKSAVQHFISRFMDSKGDLHHQLQMTTPFAVSYVTDISGNPDQDPTIYNVQLARIWKSLRQNLPAILIADSGFDWHNSGLGGLVGGFLQKGGYEFAQRSPMLASVTLDILVVSMDEQTTSDLADVLSYIFGPLVAMNRAHTILSPNPEDSWEVRLPLSGPDPSGLDRRNITDDPSDSLWSTTINLTVEFEGMITLIHDNPLNPMQAQNVGHMSSAGTVGLLDEESRCPTGVNNLKDLFTVYKAPTSIRLGRPHKVEWDRLPTNTQFFSDDNRIAVVDNQGVIRPRRLGTFNLVLMDMSPTNNPDNEEQMVLRSDPVNVVSC